MTSSTCLLCLAFVSLAVRSLASKCDDPLNIKKCASSTVCYTDPIDFGCFAVNSTNAFCKDEFLPQSPQFIAPQFHFFSVDRPAVTQTVDLLTDLDGSIGSLTSADWTRPLTVIVHGFQGGAKTWLVTAKDALIPYRTNVLLVYWQKGSSGGTSHLDYWQATANTRIVGAMMGAVTQSIVSAHPTMPADQLTLIGFSLGAHVAAFAGNFIEQRTGVKPARIIGLDPAGPLFECEDPVTRLDPTDAKFVQAIHTNGEPLLPDHGFGTTQSMGHVDFLVNGGRLQPGCEIVSSDLACSHTRAPDVFSASAKYMFDPTAACLPFIASRCESSDNWEAGKCFNTLSDTCTKFGFVLNADDGCSGRYYFATTTGTPTSDAIQYFGVEYNVKFEFNHTKLTQGKLSLRFHFGVAGSQYFNETSAYTPLEGPISRVIVAACDRLSASTGHRPTAVGVKFDSEAVIGPNSLTASMVTVQSTDGQTFTSGGAVVLPDKKEVLISM